MPKLATRHIGLLLLTCVLFCILGDSIVWACPNCKDALAGDPAQAGLIRGLFWSILFLLSMPFLITAGLGGYFYYLIRQARAATPAASQVLTEAATVGSPFAADNAEADESLVTSH